jgi:hypothetical protein
MSKKLASYISIGLLISIYAQADDSSAINLAGQQRMLSQRIVKSYCQVGLSIFPERSQNQLNQAIEKFDENLKQLELVVKNPEAMHSLAELHQFWMPLRRGAQGAITPTIAHTLDQQAEAVLRAADQLAAELQDRSTAPLSRWVNTSGRQRMLSQRLVKAYMLRQMNQDTASKRQELESASHEFSGALSSLNQRQENSKEVQSVIVALTTQWDWLQAALASDGAIDYRLVVAESSDIVLELADRVTSLISQTDQDTASK